MQATAVKTCLNGPDSQPHGFWPAVDQLALQFTALLLPLINISGRNAKNWPDLCVVHQEVHNVVAEAAFLSNMMRRSSSIFDIKFPLPGEIWSLDQNQVHEKLFESSKEAGENYDKFQVTSNREGRVHIVLWPVVKRFTAIGTTTGFANKGERISSIIKAQAVYYMGRDDEENTNLYAFIRANKLQRSSVAALLSIVWVLLCLTLLFRAYNYQQSGEWVEWRHRIEATLPKFDMGQCYQAMANIIGS